MSDEKKVTLEIAKLIGEPINPSLPVPVEISAIADMDTANPGEKVYYFASLDTDDDTILDVDANGAITVVKRTPLSDTALTFKGLNSKLEYVLLDTVLSSPDTDILARKKSAIARGMDKLELRLILTAIMGAGAISEMSVDTGDDLYDMIVKAKHAIEDYGDNFVLLCGSAVKEGIDTYDKDQAGTLNYNVGLTAKLKEIGIEVVKIFGVVNYNEVTGEPVRLLDTNKFILVARNSRIAEGKPIHFVRRRISPEIAKLMGADVDNAQRALVVNPTPVNVAGTNTLGYGVYGYESIIWAIKNPKAIVKSADVSGIL